MCLDRAGCDRDEVIRQEWPAYKIYATRLRHIATADLLESILTNDDLQRRFGNISHIFILFLCIPSSSAVVERGFSAMKRIKSDWRTCLSAEMIDRLMAISICGPSVADYDPYVAVNRWLQAAKRTRRFQGLVDN